MAGNERSGRRKHSAEEHVASGYYRPSRHGPLSDPMPETPPPAAPKGMTPDEKWMWQRIAGLGRIDEASLPIAWSLCEMWALYRAAVALAKECPADRDARINATHYLAAVHRMAAAFGLSPADRAKLGIRKTSEVKRVPARKR